MIRYLSVILLASSLLWIASCKPKQTDVTADAAIPTEAGEADLSSLYQYYHSNPTLLEHKDENDIIDYLADKGLDASRTPSGIYIHTSVIGSGDSIRWGDPVIVDYRGYFLDGREFDSSYGRGEPISFRVGNMMAGWNEALPHLRKGTKASLFIPSHMAYGKRGFPGFVGPDEILAFDLEVYVGK